MKEPPRNRRFKKWKDATSRVELPHDAVSRRQGSPMRNTEESKAWVVYRMTIHGKPTGMSAVCEQQEWDAMERAQPGHHTLIMAGLTNEGEAERLARRNSVNDNANKPPKPKAPRPPKQRHSKETIQ